MDYLKCWICFFISGLNKLQFWHFSKQSKRNHINDAEKIFNEEDGSQVKIRVYNRESLLQRGRKTGKVHSFLIILPVKAHGEMCEEV